MTKKEFSKKIEKMIDLIAKDRELYPKLWIAVTMKRQGRKKESTFNHYVESLFTEAVLDANQPKQIYDEVWVGRCAVCGAVIKARNYQDFRKKLELHAKKCFKRG